MGSIPVKAEPPPSPINREAFRSKSNLKTETEGVVVHGEEKKTDDGGGGSSETPPVRRTYYVWVRQKGQDKKVMVYFDRSWNVYALKREIVKQLVEPNLARRLSTTRTTDSDNEEEKKELEDDEDVEDNEIEREAQGGLPRPEVLKLENRWFGHRLQNNREKLEEALHDILSGGVSPENENTLLLVSHPDIPVPDHALKEMRIENPYEDIEIEIAPDSGGSDMQKIIDAAETLLTEIEMEQKGIAVKRVDPKQKELEEKEAERKRRETEDQRLQELEDRERAQREMERKKKEAEERKNKELERKAIADKEAKNLEQTQIKSEQARIRAKVIDFIDTFATPNSWHFIWIIYLICLWVGHSYPIYAGWKYVDANCNYKMGSWLFVAGLFNVLNLALFILLSLKAEWLRSHKDGSLGWITRTARFFLYVFILFVLAWISYGSFLLAESSHNLCVPQLYDTTLGYVISCWILLFLQVVWSTFRYFDRANRIEEENKQKEKKKWDKYTKRVVKLFKQPSHSPKNPNQKTHH